MKKSQFTGQQIYLALDNQAEQGMPVGKTGYHKATCYDWKNNTLLTVLSIRNAGRR